MSPLCRVGAGGKIIDAHREVMRMLELDPTPEGHEEATPMFRKPNGDAYTTDEVRDPQMNTVS